MFARGLGLNDAFTFVRARKPDVSPNFHFMEQLHTFERQLKNDPNRRIMTQTPSTSTPPSTTFDNGSGSSSSMNTPSSGTSSASSNMFRDNRKFISRHVKYSCTCNELDCKCLQASEFLLGPLIGVVSPDSGIEFDRWSNNTPK